MIVLVVPSFNELETRRTQRTGSDSEFNQTAMKRGVQCQSGYNEIVNTAPEASLMSAERLLIH